MNSALNRTIISLHQEHFSSQTHFYKINTEKGFLHCSTLKTFSKYQQFIQPNIFLAFYILLLFMFSPKLSLYKQSSKYSYKLDPAYVYVDLCSAVLHILKSDGNYLACHKHSTAFFPLSFKWENLFNFNHKYPKYWCLFSLFLHQLEPKKTQSRIKKKLDSNLFFLPFIFSFHPPLHKTYFCNAVKRTVTFE